MYYVKTLVTELRALLSDELGVVSGTSVKALFVSPGGQVDNVEGLRVVIDRNPIQFDRSITKVTDGTFFPDNYKVSLINLVENKNDEIAAQKMTEAIRKIESNYVVSRLLYVSPDEEVFEQAILYIYNPEINKE